MKRSEMVFDVIRPIIEQHLINVHLPENIESYITLDIMDAIEKAGMLPPSRTITIYQSSASALPIPPTTSTINQWEEE